MTTLERLFAEIERLEERFQDCSDAIEALEAVKFWAIEETVDPADSFSLG